MEFKMLMKIFKFKRAILIGTLLWGFSNSLAFCQSSSDSINFTKKEIAFFKWGDGTNEIGMAGIDQNEVQKDMQSHKEINKTTGQVVPHTSELKEGSFIPSTRLKIDGNDNVYFFDTIHNRILVVALDGSVIRTINLKDNSYTFKVDEAGDVLFDYQEKQGGERNLIWVKPNGEQVVYKDFHLGHFENGIVYDAYDKSKAITITNIGDGPEKLPPQLMSLTRGTDDVGNILWGDVLQINTQKINKHLKKIGRHLDVSKIIIKIEQKEDEKQKLIHGKGYVLDVDDDGNVYVLCAYKNGSGPHSKVMEAYVDVYSSNGERLARVSDPSCVGGYDEDPNRFAIDIQGNIFQILSSDDGVHIIKWVKD